MMTQQATTEASVETEEVGISNEVEETSNDSLETEVDESEDSDEYEEPSKESDDDSKETEDEDEPKKEGKKRGRKPKEKWLDDTSIEYSEDIHKDYYAPEELKGKFVDFAKDNGLTPTQAGDLLNFQAKMMEEQDKALTDLEDKEMKQTESNLKSDWGDEYESRMKSIHKFVSDRATGDVADTFLKTSFGNNESVIRFLDSIAQDFSEDSNFVSGKSVSKGSQFVSAHEEIQNEFTKDTAFRDAMRNPTHPQRDFYIKKWTEINDRYQ